MQGGSVRDPLGRASRARGRLNSQRRFEGVLTDTTLATLDYHQASLPIATLDYHQASLPNLLRPASSSPMLPGAPRSRRCPRLPARQTTPVVLSVPLALHTLSSAPPALQQELRRQQEGVEVQRRRMKLSELNRLEIERRADEGQERLDVERRVQVERRAQEGQERVQVERLEVEGRGGRAEERQQGGLEVERRQEERLEVERWEHERLEGDRPLHNA